MEMQLKALGLKESETTIYLFLLENGLSSPPQVAKGTGIQRTNVYAVLQLLKEKGLISQQRQGKRKAYVANDPQSLLQALERKREAAEKILPDLRSLYKEKKNKPTIRFFDGFDEVKQIYEMTYSSEKLLALGSTKRLSELDPDFFRLFAKNLKQHGVVLDDILSAPSKTGPTPETKDLLKGMYDPRFLPAEHGDPPTDILIWDDHVALITLEEPIFGTVLTSKPLADSFRLMFGIMWDALKM